MSPAQMPPDLTSSPLSTVQGTCKRLRFSRVAAQALTYQVALLRHSEAMRMCAPRWALAIRDIGVSDW